MKKIPAQVYSRVAGYFAMVLKGDQRGTWNKGKTEEYFERVEYKIPLSIKEKENPVLSL